MGRSGGDVRPYFLFQKLIIVILTQEVAANLPINSDRRALAAERHDDSRPEGEVSGRAFLRVRGLFLPIPAEYEAHYLILTASRQIGLGYRQGTPRHGTPSPGDGEPRAALDHPARPSFFAGALDAASSLPKKFRMSGRFGEQEWP
jgi:hypothetical protein